MTPLERVGAHCDELAARFDPDSLSLESVDEFQACTDKVAALLAEAHEGMMLVEQVRHWAATDPVYAKRNGLDPEAPLDAVIPVAYKLGMTCVSKGRGEKETKDAHQRRIRRECAIASRKLVHQLASYRLHEARPDLVDRFAARLKEHQDRIAGDSDRQTSLTV